MKTSDPSTAEVSRIQQVYQQYQIDPTIHKAWSHLNAGNQAIIQERSTVLQKILRIHLPQPLNECKILDIGCGSGGILAEFHQWGASAENLFGIDLVPDRIEVAKQLYPEMHFAQGNAERLEFPSQSFDIVILFTVFSSILSREMRTNIAEEITRVLKPGKSIVWYDFRYRNPKNSHTTPMPKQEICTLFPTYQYHLQTVTLLPPLARKLNKLTSVAYPLLAKVPLLRTHYLGLITKPL